MTAPEILNVITTVAVTQIVVDLSSRWMVFGGDPYKRAVASLERAESRRDKLVASCDTPAKQEKQSKKLARYKEDVHDAAGDVARRHAVPGFFGSVIFLILYRVLSTEHVGKVIGVMPFVPFRLMRRLTLRGLSVSTPEEGAEYNVYQACSFLFVYILCTVSVKFYVHKLVGVSPPKQAEGGFMTILDSPSNQRMLKSLGIDTDFLKEE